MDLGVVSLDGGSTGFGVSSSVAASSSDPETRLNKWYGSGFLKQERSGSGTSEDEFRTSKVAKTDDFSASKTMLWRNSNSSLRSNGSALFSETHHHQPQMLSFSSPKSDSFLVEKLTQNAALPYYSRNTGYGSGSMHGGYSGLKGPFTASQWLELEHQALIYKYITANVPVPSPLLIPIRKALDSAGFCNFSSGLLRPNNGLGWAGFHLGFSNNTDPEPGRCRRTDGKKWRCSRDAVVDQKYCERHMNRGRHRSRKPVEGQSGHAGTTTTTTATTPNNNNNNNIAVTSSSLSILVPSNSASNSLTFAHHDSSTANTINRMFMTSKETNASERMQENPFMIPKHQIPYDESSRNNEFGLVTSDSLLNPSQKSPTSLRITDTQNSLRHFIDDCPKTELDMSFTSSPTNEKLTLSPLRLSKELDPSPIQMGLGVGTLGLESNPRQASWIPISWESSMGGPLGEVLNLSSGNNNGSDQCGKNSSALNLMTDGWDSSPPLGSSPTGVLQKTAFGSLFNNSAGSSPRAEGKTHEGGNLCNDLLAPTLV